MPHTYAQNVVHVVFSTKDRRKSIPREFLPRMWSYLAGICDNDGIYAHAIGGMEDHVHLLIQIPPVLALAKAVNTLKSNSSKWANKEGCSLAWQNGYAAFSVSASNLSVVVQYIRNQESHHKRMTFDAEFLALLKKHRVPYDPTFVFG
ncbi:MAG: IS200/IS605 family transposase [Candidatus Acidiferrales bacterium]